MKTYKELNLAKVRDDNDLDFAHYTYNRGQCSCCHGPLDISKKHWRGGKKPEWIVKDGETTHWELNGRKIASEDDYNFILFKNADNGSGSVAPDDVIKAPIFVEYNEDMERRTLVNVCASLEEQLGDGFKVLVPDSGDICILIESQDAEVYDDDYKTVEKAMAELEDD